MVALTQYKITETLLRLNQIPHLGQRSIKQILEKISLMDLLNYDREAFRHLGWNEKQIRAWFHPNEVEIEKTWQWAQQDDCHLITIFDEDYPYLLKQTATPPLLLFTRGEKSLLNTPQMAMVGSRHCSSYGEYWAKYFATELTLAGFHITSGLALGIDGFCHEAVVNMNAQTIAVLGCGLNHIYPKSHVPLAKKILENRGVIVSEFLPDQPPIAKHFPQRNRIISGLSQGVLVIEAGLKSGSLITTRYALEQNRDIFALPGNIQNQFSQGCHQLIRQGATLVESVDDILDVLQPYQYVSSHKSPAMLEPQQAPREEPPLLKHIGYQVISLDELAEKTQMPIDTLMCELLDLELQDWIVQENGLYRRV